MLFYLWSVEELRGESPLKFNKKIMLLTISSVIVNSYTVPADFAYWKNGILCLIQRTPPSMTITNCLRAAYIGGDTF